MSTRPENTINLTSSNNETLPSEEEVQAHIVRQLRILDRGGTGRFTIEDCPPHLHYEWHRDDPETYARLIDKGFQIDDELAKKSRFIHTDGAGHPRIGDVRCYSIPRWKHELNLKIEAEKAARNRDPKRAKTDFVSAIKASGIPGLVTDVEASDGQPVLEPSSTVVSGDELAAILNSNS